MASRKKRKVTAGGAAAFLARNQRNLSERRLANEERVAVIAGLDAEKESAGSPGPAAGTAADCDGTEDTAVESSGSNSLTPKTQEQSRRKILSKSIAADICRGILDSEGGEFKGFTLRAFDKLASTGAKRSPAYSHFKFVATLNTKRPEGYILCNYVGQNGCTIKSGNGGALRVLDPKQGTSAMMGHISSVHPEVSGVQPMSNHTDQNGSSGMELFQVNAHDKSKVTDFAAVAFAHAHLPFSVLEKGSSTSEHAGLHSFCGALIRPGQNQGCGVEVDVGHLLVQGDAVASALSRVADLERKNDAEFTIPAALAIGGGISSDGVKTKAGQKLRDLSLHYIAPRKPQTASGSLSALNDIMLAPPPCLFNRTLCLVSEATDAPVTGSPSAIIRSVLDAGLRARYGQDMTLDRLQGRCTLTTDCCPTEAAIFNTSTSVAYVKNETHFSCLSHRSSTATEHGLDADVMLKSLDPDVRRVGACVKAVFECQTAFAKSDIEFALPKKFEKKSKTRFMYAQKTVSRFLEISSDVNKVAKSKKCRAALAALGRICLVTRTMTADQWEKAVPGDHRIDEALPTGLADKAASLNAFVTTLEPMRALNDWSQKSKKPTMHYCLFQLNSTIRKLGLLANGSAVLPENRDSARAMKLEARRMCQKLSKIVSESIAVKIELHPLMAAGALLFPAWVIRDLGDAFKGLETLYPGQLSDLRAEGRETLLRFMCESEAHPRVTQKCETATASAASADSEDGNAPAIDMMECDDDDLLLMGPTEPSQGGATNGLYGTAEEEFIAYEEYCATRGPFEDFHSSGYTSNLLDLRDGGSYDGMGVVLFWMVLAKRFPRLSQAAMRVLAIPVSQSLSERTFSLLNNAQTPQQCRQSEQHLENRVYVKCKSDEGELVSFMTSEEIIASFG